MKKRKIAVKIEVDPNVVKKVTKKAINYTFTLAKKDLIEVLRKEKLLK